MYKQMCTCDPKYFNSVAGICLACGAQGVLTQNLRPLSQSNCQHGSPYFDLIANRCVVCGVPGVPVPVSVPQQGLSGQAGQVGQGYPIAPPMPMPAPSPNLLQHVFNAIRAGFKPLEPLSETPPKPTEEELLKRANDAFPVLTAKELLCHRCCTIMRPRVSMSGCSDLAQVEITCHGVSDHLLFGVDIETPVLREIVLGMLQDLQGKTRDDWTF